MDLHIKLSFGTPSFSIEGTTTTCHLPVRPSDSLGEGMFVSIASATLKEGDTYDEAIGKKVALAKAESHAYRVIAAVLKKEIIDLESLIQSANRFIEKANGVVEHNQNYINQF